MDLAQLHALIDGLTHIVDGEQGGGNARQGLHLHAGDARRLDGAERLHSLPLGQKPEVHAHFRQRQRMTQRDELAGALGGHDAGNAGHAQHIAFLHGAALHGGECLGVHGDDAVGGGLPEGDGLLAHIHHHGVAGGIKVGQFVVSHSYLYSALCSRALLFFVLCVKLPVTPEALPLGELARERLRGRGC